MASETARAAEHTYLRSEVDRARRRLAVARERGAGPTELRLLTERAAACMERLRRWRERQEPA